MTLAEYKAWLDGMIAATDDDRLKAARAKVDEVTDAPQPVVVPSVWPSPAIGSPWWQSPYTTCGTASIKGCESATCWNGRLT